MSDPKTLVQEQLARNSWGLLGTQGHVLGIDLGGYGLRAALVDLHSRTYTNAHAEIQDPAPQQVVDQAIALTRELLKKTGVTPDRLVRIGIGFGGPVDPIRGVARLSTRVPGWENFPITEPFEQTFDAVTLLDNDATLTALGEATFGTGQNCENLFYMHLSSGVGGGLVINGQLYHGATATAGEIGHVLVSREWEGVSETATLEELVSINGLLRRARQQGLDTQNLNDIFSEHPVAQRVVAETVNLLALRMAQITTLLDPQVIVLGGIVVRIGGERFVQAIDQQMRQFIAPQFAHSVKVVASVLGVESIAIGALALALKSLRD
jgi:glucokinase